MTAERWSRLRRLLDRALDEPAERPRLLERLRREDPALCRELEGVLADYDAEADSPEPPAPDLAGQRVGPYEIVRELGRGGSSTVFLAARAADDQDRDVRLPVALKLLRQSFLADSLSSAFRRERRILIRLDHPHIARLLDWGTIPGGLLYLVLEYVEGEPLTAYCARRQSTLDERLRLFLDVCAAVEHAHQNLVVHRDLKPANIFVSADGEVKLLDFGVAAALDAALPPHTTLHRLTPTYASPEQMRGEAVTVATDIYSLGVVLYELLTGKLPYAANAARAVLEDPPRPPSQAGSPAGIGRGDLEGDLDAIILKALRKEPELRYRSVEQMSADIRRYMGGRPVLAREGSRAYVLRRFIRRNRVNVALAGFAILALAAGAGVSAWKWRAAENNLRVAENRYRALRSFARAMIANVDAGSASSPLEMQRRMSGTAARFLDELSRERSGDEDLQLEIADAYRRIGSAQGAFMRANEGDASGALANFRKAYAIDLAQWRAHRDRRAGLDLLWSSRELAGVTPDPAAAVHLLGEALEASSQLAARYPNDPEVLVESAEIRITGGQRLRNTGELAGSLAMFRQAMNLADGALRLRPNDPGALSAREVGTAEAASVLCWKGDCPAALALHQEAYRMAIGVLEQRPGIKSRRQVAFKELSMVDTLRKLHRASEAEQHSRQALEGLQAIAAEDASNQQAQWDLALAWYRLGSALADQGEAGEALRAHSTALHIRRQEFERQPANLLALSAYISSLNRVGDRLLETGRDLAAAERNFDRAIAIYPALSARTPSDVYALSELARAYRGKAEIALRLRRPEAAQLEERSVGIWREVRRRSPLDADLAAQAAEAERRRAGLAVVTMGMKDTNR